MLSGLALSAGTLASLAAGGCGKKGPPMAPFVRIPAAIEAIEATRVGDEVYVTLRIPTANIDTFSPADVSRVEVYGYTGEAPPPRGRFVEFGTHVASVPVAPPGGAAGAELPVQGTSITIRDTLTPDELAPGQQLPADGDDVRAPSSAGDGLPRSGVLAATPPNAAGDVLRRFYTAYPFSARNRVAPPGGVAEVPLLPLPDPPPRVDVTYDEREVTVRWEPSGGLIGYLLERPLPDEPLAAVARRAEAPEPETSRYHVYRSILPEPLAPRVAIEPAAWQAAPPSPLNAQPVAALAFTDAVEFGRERCYAVRAVRGAGARARVGRLSPDACVTPVDTFPPAAPQSLASVAADGAINLIWEPNQEADLAGYLVLRGEAPGATLHPLTPGPIADARYRDATVTPGVRYVYAVVALDTRLPLPNLSPESNRVEETAR